MPVSVDPLYVSVSPITIINQEETVGTATGFFFENNGNLFFITNRHVVVDLQTNNFIADKLSLRVHTDAQNLSSNANISITVINEDGTAKWKELGPSIDIISLKLSDQFRSNFLVHAFSQKDFPPQDLIVGPGQSLLAIGYPLGFHDQAHNFPIMRNAALATAFPVPFNNNPYYLIDANLHEGMSGGPVITKPTNSYQTLTGTNMYGGAVWYFMGIQSHTWPQVGMLGNPLTLNAVWFPELIAQITS